MIDSNAKRRRQSAIQWTRIYVALAVAAVMEKTRGAILSMINAHLVFAVVFNHGESPHWRARESESAKPSGIA